MLFSSLKFDLIRTDELRRLIWQTRELTRDGCSGKTAQAFSLLEKILSLSKADKDWYVYFDALYDMLYMQKELGSSRKVLQYGEIFYRDSRKYFDIALPGYPNTRMAEHYSLSYNYIFTVYKEFYQIDDAKMDVFLEQYWQAADKYGVKGRYGLSLIQLALLYGDKALAREGFRIFQKYGDKSCYICVHQPIMGYHLLMDEPDEALELIGSIISKNIPADERWCYKICQCAGADTQYSYFLGYCLLLGKADLFRQVLPRYIEALDADDTYTLEAFLRAAAGDFTLLETDLTLMKKDRKDPQTGTTMSELYDALCWYAYLRLLDRSGTKAVPFDLSSPTLPPKDAAGMYRTADLAAWFEGIADELGMKFDRSRKRFHYAALKKSYEDCAGL